MDAPPVSHPLPTLQSPSSQLLFFVAGGTELRRGGVPWVPQSLLVPTSTDSLPQFPRHTQPSCEPQSLEGQEGGLKGLYAGSQTSLGAEREAWEK